MDVRVLGPLEVLLDEVALDLGPRRQRAVLARLLLNADEATSVERLIEDLWPGDVPDSARHTVHVYLSNLRAVLGPERDRGDRAGEAEAGKPMRLRGDLSSSTSGIGSEMGAPWTRSGSSSPAAG